MKFLAREAGGEAPSAIRESKWCSRRDRRETKRARANCSPLFRFRKPSGNFQGLLGIFVEFIVKLYREPQLPQTRCEVLTAFLDTIWGTIPVCLSLLHLRKSSVQFFGLNCVGHEQFDDCFDRWYAQPPDKLVGL
jgi:hypothetical protein